MYTLSRKKCNFPEVAFLGEECMSVSFRPNVISPMLLVTIFCPLLLGAFYLVHMTQGHEKILVIKIAFLLGTSVFPNNHRFVRSCGS